VWNQVKTAALLASLGGLLVVAGSFFGEPGALIGLVAGLLAVAGSYWYSDRLALRTAGAIPLQPGELPGYQRLVRELCAQANLPVPRLYITPDLQPNAFATGRNPRHAAVAVTRGALDLLEERELQAVLAHELAHVANRDILLTSIAAALGTGISFLAQLLSWQPLFGGSVDGSEDEERPGPWALLASVLLAPVAATLMQLALSRSREFEADRTGAALLGDGRALASALTKIDAAAARYPMDVEPAQAGKYLVNPLTGGSELLSALFRTHPPTRARIARLLRTPWG
jgi:heat shock protein HtpX